MNLFDYPRRSPSARRAARLAARWPGWIVVAVTLAGVIAPSHAAKYREGVHYYSLFEAQPIQTGNRVEVLEIFWYHCPHCYAMEPIIEKWIAKRKPDYVELRRLPGVFRRETEFDARVYFAAAQMGIVERIHSGVYQEIHVRRNRFRSLDDLDFLLGRNDIDPQAFAKAFHSNQVDARMKYAETMYEKYEASGVPTIIVDGRYRTTASAAGGYEALMDVTEFLVKKAASERGSLRVSR